MGRASPRIQVVRPREKQVGTICLLKLQPVEAARLLNQPRDVPFATVNT